MHNCTDSFVTIRKHPFKVIAFDWDGTAVENRRVDAQAITEQLEALLKFDVYIIVITGTNFNNIDNQFSAHIKGPHKQNLFICTDRGSEVRGFNEDSEPVLLFERIATPEEEELLTKVAEAVKSKIESESEAAIEIVYNRLNRRKIDLNPDWPDPAKSRIDELLVKTEERLVNKGFKGGIREAFDLAHKYSDEFDLRSARITSDVKHVEVGLTDKSDSMLWILRELAAKKNIAQSDILVLGDEFGPIAGFDGSDFLTYVPEAPNVTYVSVGKEPNGVPERVIHIDGGPACFLELMKAQVELYKKLSTCLDESFILREEGFSPLREHEIESVYTVGNGYLGTRGSLEEQSNESAPTTLVAGIYDRKGPEEIEELIIAPDWVFTQIFVDGKQLKMGQWNTLSQERVLDMKKGIYSREWQHKDKEGRITKITFMRFTSLADPHALGLKITVVPENYSADVRIETGIKLNKKFSMGVETTVFGAIENGGGYSVTTTKFTDYTIAQTQLCRIVGELPLRSYTTTSNKNYFTENFSWNAHEGAMLEIEKMVSIYTNRDSSNPLGDAMAAVTRYQEAGLEELLLEHIKIWEERWKTAAIVIEGDPEGQKWANFAAYHLIIAANYRDERISISARTLTGTIYKGHVFWDTEMFMLPFFIFTDPKTARALLMYRYNTLAGARKEADDASLDGALFAWESTVTGEEMTPEFVISPNGEVILILSGKMEQHINIAVAYGVWLYWTATKDEEFFVNHGAEILIETARFWASRVERRDGKYHIYNIEGPDEYHEIVNDNMYTNLLAVWNIIKARDTIEYLEKIYPDKWSEIKSRIGFKVHEIDHWLDVTHNMYRGKPEHGNLIEQFDGYFLLKDIDVNEYKRFDGPLDNVLGREETANSRLVKQADVVLLLYLLEQQFTQEVIEENYMYYERRTGHGSSLSPSTYGLVAARLGLMDFATQYFHEAGQIDLANNMGNAAGGVHAAALGGLWQQIIMGFAGIRINEEGILIYPHLPKEWKSLKFTLVWRGSELEFDIKNNQEIIVRVGDKREAFVGVFGKELKLLFPGRTYRAEWDGVQWSDFKSLEREGVA